MKKFPPEIIDRVIAHSNARGLVSLNTVSFEYHYLVKNNIKRFKARVHKLLTNETNWSSDFINAITPKIAEQLHDYTDNQIKLYFDTIGVIQHFASIHNDDILPNVVIPFWSFVKVFCSKSNTKISKSTSKSDVSRMDNLLSHDNKHQILNLLKNLERIVKDKLSKIPSKKIIGNITHTGNGARFICPITPRALKTFFNGSDNTVIKMVNDRMKV